jgi:D-alanyl-D-alanine carboxypeptidase/D-alanyl-D-alanine-endopeptidase (penicillin-binding protein 4)
MRKSFTVSSPQMREILKSTLKRSINPFAQAVFLRLGQRTSLDLTPTLNELAEKGIREFLVELGVSDHERIKLFDGAGLSRENRVTARSLTQFLERLKERPEIFQQFVNTLAIAGVDGTLKNRLKGTAAQGRVFGKTGSLAGTHHLAGYVRNREGEYVPFVMLARESAGSTTDISQARPAMDRVLKRLAEILLQAD